MRTGARGTHKPYIRVRIPLRSTAPLKEALDLAEDFRERSIQGFAPRIDDDGPLGVQPIQKGSDGFTEAPANAIAHHGLTDGTWHGKPDTRPVRLRLSQAERRKERAAELGAGIINSAEI